MKIEELRNKDGGLAERQVAWSEIREKEAGLELFHARFMSCSEKTFRKSLAVRRKCLPLHSQNRNKRCRAEMNASLAQLARARDL